ncbi:hypothetical protein BJV40_004459 [Clostridium beijerinckii]|nr:hypothetical protein [Clostridium beijerinckii]
MKFEILKTYIELCKSLNKQPTFTGIAYFRAAFKY